MSPKLVRETVGLYLLYMSYALFWLSVFVLVLCVAKGAPVLWTAAALISAFFSAGGAYITKDVFDVQPPMQVPGDSASSNQFYDPADH